MRIMAIDYGDAHTGIAISDPTGFLAGFTTTINAYRPEAVADQVASLAREHGVEELVLGYPKNMDGTLGPRAEKAQAIDQTVINRKGYHPAHVTDITQCIACASCAKICPDSIITVEKF